MAVFYSGHLELNGWKYREGKELDLTRACLEEKKEGQESWERLSLLALSKTALPLKIYTLPILFSTLFFSFALNYIYCIIYLISPVDCLPPVLEEKLHKDGGFCAVLTAIVF